MFLETDARTPTRVLLIDDNVAFAYFVRDVLNRAHAGEFETTCADSLAQGVKCLADGRDVVLLDLGLPDSTGFETFARVRAAGGDAAIVILTCLDDQKLATDAVRQGAQDYLLKDQVDKQLLVRAIRYAHERARIERHLRALSARLLTLQDEERRRIARSLHDVTAQNLAALQMNLDLLARKLPPNHTDTRRVILDCLDRAAACTQELRTTSYLLHPPLIEELGLGGAVREYADGFARRSGIRVDLEIPPLMPRLSRESELAVFRVIQEALANVHRHAQSPTASIRMDLHNEQLRIVIADRGRGFAAGCAAAAVENGPGQLGVGIAGMRERLRQIGGRLDLQGDSSGVTVLATVPLGAQPAGAGIGSAGVAAREERR